MRISDWSSDVCSSDLADDGVLGPRDRRLLGLSAGGEISIGDGTSIGRVRGLGAAKEGTHHWWHQRLTAGGNLLLVLWFVFSMARLPAYDHATLIDWIGRSEEHTSELQSLMRISYAVFCLKKKKRQI